VYIEMFADMRRVRRGSNFGALWAMAMTDSMALWLFWMYLYLYLNLCLCLCLCPTLTCFRFLYGCSLDWGLACFQHLTAAVKKNLKEFRRDVDQVQELLNLAQSPQRAPK